MDASAITSALGVGSGLNIRGIVDSLAAASKAPREAQLARRETANQARISSLAQLASSVDGFASALNTLIAGGTLRSQPTVSAPTLMTATALNGSRLGNLTATVEVRQLAQAEVAQSVPVTDRTAAIGQGALTLTTARGSFSITVDAANDSLDGLARSINAANSGLTATILSDPAGARLVLKGATGAAETFSLSVASGGGSGIERFAYGAGATGAMTQAQPAQDAIVAIDNIPLNRPTNSFSDLIPGVQINLQKAEPGTMIRIGSRRPTAEMDQAIRDFVSAYNELQTLVRTAATPPANGGIGEDGAGALRGNTGLEDLRRRLAALPTTALTSGTGGPTTLSEIGVRTNRDGTLSVDSVRLNNALTNNPDAVEAMFNPSITSSSPAITARSASGRTTPGTYALTDMVPGTPPSGRINGVAMVVSGNDLIAPASSAAAGLIVTLGNGAPATGTVTVEPGLGGALQLIRDSLRSSGSAFAGTNERLARESRAIAEDRATLERRSAQEYNRLLATYAAMDRNVSAFRATQGYLEQQVKLWTNDRG